ncbi:PorT family protein [Tellurirhabdus bombi]|uniref:PorT family protein n=1 Tax=Tellurirhabdus bombi TaxID=2907205 RepID=UPI001F287AF9|nr:PorT family protein [Tellurirhabdus bombi]
MSSVDELPDDEGLDKLFRTSAEEFEPPYNPEDWSNLRHRLDQTDRTALLFRLLRWGLPILFLLLTGTGIWLWQHNKQTNEQPVTPTTLSESGNGRTTSANKSGRVDQSGFEATKTAPTLPPLMGGTAGQRDKIASNGVELPKSTASPEGRLTAEQAAETERSSMQFTKKPRNIVDKSVDKEITVDKRGENQAYNVRYPQGKRATNVLLPTPNLQAGYASKGATPASRSAQRRGAYQSANGTPTDQVKNSSSVDSSNGPNWSSNLIAERFHFSSSPDPLAPLLLRLSDSALALKAEPTYKTSRQTKTPRFSPLSIRLQFTPDLNFIGGSGPAVSPNVGVFVEYRFTNRLLIQVGAMKAVKKYYASMEDYKIPTDHWYQKERPIRIDANCTIIDIPINVRFDVFASTNQRWFLSSGISSYIMKKEKYHYEYDPVPANNKYPGWEGNTGRVDASHLNFSVGYERYFSRRLSWQVEPFLKTPLKGVGYGKVRLLSTGIFLSARYNI